MRSTVALFALANVARTVLTAQYFVSVPIVFDVVLASCLAWAFFTTAR